MEETLNLFNEEKEKPNTEKFADLTDEAQKMATMVAGIVQGIVNKESQWAKMPEFKDGDNPYTWLNEFWAACVTNKIGYERKLEMLPTLLKGTAGNWFRVNRTQFKEFGNVGDAKEGSFVRRFIEQYAGPEKQYEWSRQL